jgi:hypothetical protein
MGSPVAAAWSISACSWARRLWRSRTAPRRGTCRHPWRARGVDRALADHLRHPEDFSGVAVALDLLSDTLLSHLAYEERELVEPLARLGFYPGQLGE